MPETVLAGVDPHQPAIDQLTGQPLTIEELLRRRGLLATGGRYTMFPGDSSTLPSSPTDQSAVAAQIATNNGATPAASAGAGAGAVSSVAASAPNATNQALPVPDETLDGMSEGDVTGLLVGLGLGGAALAAYLMRRRAKLNGAAVADDIPLVEGEVIEDGKTVTGDKVVNGKVQQQNKVIPASQTKQIAQGADVPNNAGVQALGAPKEVDVPPPQKGLPKPTIAGVLTDQRKPDRRARARAIIDRSSRTQPNDMGVVTAKDAMTDLTPEERALANTLVQQLKQNRRAGNAVDIRRKQGKRNLRSTLPTGTVREETLLNNVVAAIRKARMSPSTVARAVR